MQKLILIIMVNLLFGCTTESNQNYSPMKTKQSVIEVVVFETYLGYSKKEVEATLTSLNDIVKLQPGFIKRTTANNGDGKYVDVVYWTDIESAKKAATNVMKNPDAVAVFNVIKPESIEIYHLDTFNQFEE